MLLTSNPSQGEILKRGIVSLVFVTEMGIQLFTYSIDNVSRNWGGRDVILVPILPRKGLQEEDDKELLEFGLIEKQSDLNVSVTYVANHTDLWNHAKKLAFTFYICTND